MSAARHAALLLVPLALLPAGCGSDRPERALGPVRLTVDGPPDGATVDRETVEVHGRVTPASARVYVGGDEAGVDGGAFSAVVRLDEGANVVDVQASAPRRAAAMTALRLIREVPVEVPDLKGQSQDDAVRRLEELGLRAKVERAGGLLDDILPGGRGVCRTQPAGGEHVRAGATVTVQVSKTC
jgi:hypothetical protein